MGRPVLLVPGAGGSPLYFALLGRRLARDGFRPVAADPPLLGLGRVEATAESLAEQARRTGARKLDIVAQSAGGLAARYYIEFLDGARHVGRLVTLGTPHRGTWFAFPWFWYPLGRQVLPDSAFLKELNARPPSVPTTCIAAALDTVCIPWWSAHLPGASNRTAPCGHGGLLVHPGVYRWVREALATQPDLSGRRPIPPALP